MRLVDILGSYRDPLRNHRLLLYISLESLPHIVGVFIPRVILQNRPIHDVAELVVHFDSDSVADSHEEIDKEAAFLLTDVFQELHECRSESETTIVRGDSESGDMTVPVLSVAFSLAHDYKHQDINTNSSQSNDLLTVSHDFSARRFRELEVFRPMCEILHVERQSVCFRQRVEVYSVELEHIIADKRPQSAHFRNFSINLPPELSAEGLTESLSQLSPLQISLFVVVSTNDF
jgi:hypothetical protein